MLLDKKITDPKERLVVVNKFLEENPNPSSRILETLADYLVFAIEKETRTKEVTTANRAKTITKRETSFEGLVSQLEGGEDGIYNMVTDNKNELLSPKITISKRDIEESKDLQQLRKTIKIWEDILKTTEDEKNKYLIKKMLIEMRRDQYLIKMSNRPPIIPKKITKTKTVIFLDSHINLTEKGEFKIKGFSFLRSDVCAQMLQNYSKLHQDCSEDLSADMWCSVRDFDALSERALQSFPILLAIVKMKIDGRTNQQIREKLFIDFQVEYSEEFISSLWCRRIPNLIAEKAQDEWLDWYFLEREKGLYKKCSKCGQNKLALPRNFTKNKTSRDGLYSICKECRNNKAVRSK